MTNGTFVYHCQHGEEECKGNLLEICIIKNCQFDPNLYLHVLTCVEIQVMAGHSFETSVPACVKLFRSTKSYKWIKECSEVHTKYFNKGVLMMQLFVGTVHALDFRPKFSSLVHNLSVILAALDYKPH